MNASVNLLAQTADSFRTIEYDLPQSTLGILAVIGGLVLLFGLAIRTSLKDSRFLNRGWRGTLLALRLIAYSLILFILLNPRERTQTTQIQPSRVGVLIDTSLSMAYPVDPSGDESSQQIRADVVREQLVDNQLLDELSKTHAVSVYTFDSALQGPVALISDGQTTFLNNAADLNPEESGRSDESAGGAARVTLDEPEESGVTWPELLQPRGTETRLGESLHQTLGQLSGRTLAGVVVVSDGRSNAGLDVEVARMRAERSGTRIISLGVGSPDPQVNLWLAGMQSPSDVHRGDPFDIAVIAQGSGLRQQKGQIVLFQQSAGSNGSDRQEVARMPFEFGDDDIPAEVSFQQKLNVPGKYEYVAVAELADGRLKELTLEDNQRRREVEVTDRRQKVLIISSGPMREYQFVRNTLFRHSGIDSDVWLQTIQKDNVGMVSQESTQLLTEFPATEAKLFEYDVIVAFDADWSLLSGEQQEYLNRWVDEHSGGIVFVAGEIFTPELARTPEKFRDIGVLYPVVLNRMLAELKVTQRADKPWPILLTPEGRTSEFLKISDETGKADVELWKKFKGIFRSYPVKSVRDGAVVLAKYGNPRASTAQGLPAFLASQFYGKGRTMFVGSAETWRLRAISPEGHQRFWTSLIREVGQGRRSRGRSRGVLLLDKSEVSPGQTVTLRAQLFDARMQPLQRDSVRVSIIDDQGRPVSVPQVLRADPRRPGQFVNVFRPSRADSYRISVPVPESSDVLQAGVEVVVPNLESEDPSQNVALLTSVTEQTEGTYLPLEEAASRLPDLLPDCSEPVVVDEQTRTLWDRRWLMYLMVGLLGLEWALRRLVKLS